MSDTEDPKAWLRRHWSMDPREALYQKRLHGPNVVLPPDFAGLRLEDLERLVEEIERPRVEAEAAAASARRIAEAPLAVGRALQGAPKRRTPARLRVAFLRQLERWGTISQAAAAVGVDRRTIQRWRRTRPEFDLRCEEALARRGQMLEDEAMARARRTTTRPFFYGGRQVGQVEQYNDQLLVRMIGQFANRRQGAGSAPALTPESIATIVRAAVEGTIRQMSQDARQAESQAAGGK